MSTCPHCPDGHERPQRRAWAVTVGPERDHDDQPITLHVGKTGCQHVAETDAEWLRQVIQEAQGASTPADRLGMVDAILHTWREAGPVHPQTGELWRMIRTAVDGQTA